MFQLYDMFMDTVRAWNDKQLVTSPYNNIYML